MMTTLFLILFSTIGFISLRLIYIIINLNTILKLKIIQFEIENQILEHFNKLNDVINDFKYNGIKNGEYNILIHPKTPMEYINIKI